MKEPSTRAREIDALVIAMQELQVNHGTIVTLDEEEEIVLDEGIISVVPLTKFFLR
jgi:predicted AAA+ superfamily ATPase